MTTLYRSNASRLKEHWQGIMDERSRRIAENFFWNGQRFDYSAESKARITGAASLAGFKLLQPIPPIGYQWMDGETDFGWIAADNSVVLMTAQECFDFGAAAAAHERAHIFAAAALKAMDPIPADYTDDSYWP
ncbi:DUF4376 domain-containing protein [Pseudooceanicola sp.]|uniref:DUF4376 domain-containing protein n=1 Tax=Pseudooceanicola sp. TaxID=1914328 RepID=UPI0035C74D5B